MDKTEIYQVLTLWFVVLIFVQTASPQSGGIYTVIALVALVLMWALPVYLLLGIIGGLTAQ